MNVKKYTFQVEIDFTGQGVLRRLAKSVNYGVKGYLLVSPIGIESNSR